MSRTFRNIDGIRRLALRRPKTFGEIKKLDGILHNEDLTSLIISGFNRLRSREHSLPTLWGDKVASAYYENYHWDAK